MQRERQRRDEGRNYTMYSIVNHFRGQNAGRWRKVHVYRGGQEGEEGEGEEGKGKG